MMLLMVFIFNIASQFRFAKAHTDKRMFSFAK